MFDKINLYNGTKMPAIGLGIWKITDKHVLSRVMNYALDLGYRHIDTATFYQNDNFLGHIIEAKGLDRTDLFISTKLPAHVLTYQEVLNHYETARSRMDLDYFNLFMINAPWPWNQRGKDFSKEMTEVWRAMEDLYLNEQVSAIGVSNFSIKDLENLIQHARILPMTHQIAIYPGHVDRELLAYCQKHHIVIQAYSPFKQGLLINHPKLLRIAETYHVTSAQLMLKFLLQLGVYPIFKTVHESYLDQNVQLDFKISEEDMDDLIHLEDNA